MKIVRFVSSFPTQASLINGSESSAFLGPNVYALSVEQQRLGEEVHVICKGTGTTDYLNGITVHRVKSPLNLTSTVELIRQNKESRVHIVHIHATNGLLTAALTQRMSIAPMVAHVHGTTIGSSFLTAIAGGSFMRIASSLARENFAWKAARRVIAVSQSVSRELSEYYDIPPEKIRVVYNGVDTQIFKPQPFREEIRKRLGWEDKSVILYVGRLAPLKGLTDLIQAAKRLCSKRKDVLFALAGGIPKFQDSSTYKYVDGLKSLIKSSGLQNKVVFLGPVPNPDLPRIYSAADIFVLPSLSEGTPKVALEAMACAKPCVLTSVGGMPELITSAEGRIAQARNPDSLADELEDLLRSEREMIEMGMLARNRVLANFTWKIAAMKLAEIYSELA